MYHEATACHVGGDLLELLSLLLECAKSVRMMRDSKDAHAVLLGCKDWHEALRRLATLLNTYNPAELRNLCIGKTAN
jgi:ubiquitin carboxyl-terminal hydrolase 34